MQVILAEVAEVETWLNVHWREAVVLQRRLPDGKLKIVVRGNTQDDLELG